MAQAEIHSFNCDLAAEIGVIPAVLFQSIAVWVRSKEANGRDIHDGKAWTFQGGPGLADQFFYLKPRTIMENLQRLERDGYLLSRTDLNEHPFDRTKWYAIGPAGMPWRFVGRKTAVRSADSADARADSADDKNKEAVISSYPVITKKREKAALSSSEPATRLADLLLKLIRQRKPDYVRKGNWAKDIDLMIRVDKRTPEAIEVVIRWSQGDTFWCNNILSGATLRKQFDRLDLQRKRTGPIEEDPEERLRRMREKGLL